MKQKKINEYDENKIDFIVYKIIAGLIFFFVVLFYALKFGTYADDKVIANWGAMGDYFGGMLNPIFAFMSFLALLATIKIQTRELSASRREMEISSEALIEQSNSFKIQNESIKIQSFENTFFNMLALHNEIVDKLKLIQKERIDNKFRMSMNHYDEIEKQYFGKDVVGALLKNFKNSHLPSVFSERETIESREGKFNEKYDSIISQYYGFIYQILKFIDESKIENKQKYSSLYRSLFSQAELELLFYHCMGHMGSVRFRPLLEKYHFLEHLMYQDNKHLHKLILKYYDKNVFGENIFWTILYGEALK